jgi:hypothetical protein
MRAQTWSLGVSHGMSQKEWIELMSFVNHSRKKTIIWSVLAGLTEPLEAQTCSSALWQHKYHANWHDLQYDLAAAALLARLYPGPGFAGLYPYKIQLLSMCTCESESVCVQGKQELSVQVYLFAQYCKGCVCNSGLIVHLGEREYLVLAITQQFMGLKML